MGKDEVRRNHDDGIEDARASDHVVQLVANWDIGVLRGVAGRDDRHLIAWALSPQRARQLAASLLRAANTCEPPASAAEALRRASVQRQVERDEPAPTVLDASEAQTEPLELGVGWCGRNVVGYCCARCWSIHTAHTVFGAYRKWPEQRELQWAREQAERCCQCHYCDAPLTQADKERDGYDSDAPSLRQCCAACYEPERTKALAWAARCKVASDAEVVLHDAALAFALDRDAALRLEERMSAISERYYCAGWLIDLEHSLWAMLQGGSREFGMGEVTEAELEELRRLHERAGGWWACFEGAPEHDSDHGNLSGGVRFVPTATWLIMAR